MTLLKQFSEGNNKISYEKLGLQENKDLVIEIQTVLSGLGIIDPPIDGNLGPITLWGMDTFKQLNKIPSSVFLDKATATALLNAKVVSLLPLKPANDFAGKIVNYMLKKEFWIARVVNCVNIVYVEGMNTNGKLNKDKPNIFNDIRMIIGINSKRVPFIRGIWEATTEPGKFYTENPMNESGAARIKFGQYRAWAIGEHGEGIHKHEALRQVEDLPVHRDLNKDYKRTGDAIEIGMFGINQHWGYDNPIDNIGRASAGCLVGRERDEHKTFMKILKTDPKYKVNNRYRYHTAIIAGDDL